MCFFMFSGFGCVALTVLYLSDRARNYIYPYVHEEIDKVLRRFFKTTAAVVTAVTNPTNIR